MFLEPRKKFDVPLNIKITAEAMLVLKEYSLYTGYELDEMVIRISEKLLEDPGFLEHIHQKRHNKRLTGIIEKANRRESAFSEFSTTDEPTPF